MLTVFFLSPYLSKNLTVSRIPYPVFHIPYSVSGNPGKNIARLQCGLQYCTLGKKIGKWEKTWETFAGILPGYSGNLFRPLHGKGPARKVSG